MKRFVKPGATVGLLINAPDWWKLPGSHTHPDLTLAVIVAALEAGAKEIHYLIDPLAGYWKRSTLAAKYGTEIGAVKKCSRNYVEKEVARNKTLKKASVVKEFLDCDVFVNLPIIKHHVGVGMSGNLKNLMGVNTNASNQFFHAGSGAKGEYDDIPFLAQCVADLNTLRKPDLCVADATEFLLTNGPSGPGELRKTRQGHPRDRSRGRRRLRRAAGQPEGGRCPHDHEVRRMGPRPDGPGQAGGRRADRLKPLGDMPPGYVSPLFPALLRLARFGERLVRLSDGPSTMSRTGLTSSIKPTL